MGCYAKLKSQLDEKHLPYNEIKEGVIEVFEKKENIGSVRVVIGFDEPDSTRPWFRCFELGRFPEEKTAAALIACNNANKEYRWVRFSLDEEHDIVCAADAIVDEETVFDEVVELIVRMMRIVDTVYPTFMQARWS